MTQKNQGKEGGEVGKMKSNGQLIARVRLEDTEEKARDDIIRRPKKQMMGCG